MEFGRGIQIGYQHAGNLLSWGDPLKFIPRLILSGLVVVWFLINVSKVALAEVPEAKRVQSLEVQLSIDGSIYEGLQERIQFSISRVGEKVLLSQPLSLLEGNREALKVVIFNVFSKALDGFRIEMLDIVLGEHTKIFMNLIPLPPFITDIDLNVQMQGVSREIVLFSKSIIEKTQSELNQVFVGLPVASMVWADGIFDMVSDYIIEREFPGFLSEITLEPGAVIRMNLLLTPEEPVINEVTVRHSSTTIPVILVGSYLNHYESELQLLKGTPVDYLVHYQPDIERFLTDYLENDLSQIKALGLETRIALEPSVETRVKVMTDSQIFRTQLELRAFFGDEDYSNLQGYIGYRIDGYEIYANFGWGNHPVGRQKIGFKIPISTNFDGGFEYDLGREFRNICLYYQFERGDYLGLKLGVADAPNEALIGIRINDYLNLELVEYDRDFGVQLKFHFW